MHYKWLRALLIGLIVVSIACVSVATTLGTRKISSVKELYAEHIILYEAANQARHLIDNINSIAAGFTSIALPLDPSEREVLVSEANQGFEALQAEIPKFILSNKKTTALNRLGELEGAAEALAHAWEEVRRAAGNDMQPDEAAHHFLKLHDNATIIRNIVHEIESSVTNAGNDLAESIHEMLRSIASSLMLAVLLGASISVVACLGTGYFSTIIRRANSAIRERDLEVIAKGRHLSIALENMMHGICMFDSDKRLVVCNEKYGTIYGLGPDQLKIGTSLQSILEARVVAGSCPENGQQYIETRLAEVEIDKAHVVVNRLRDGRFIDVSHQPLPEGGWVAIHHDITEQKTFEEKIGYMAHHDALTGLPNRVQLREHIDRNLKHAKRGGSFAVLCLDLDHFKNINDSLGHSIGDALLCAASSRLRDLLRDTDLVARTGGDEFAIVQANIEAPMLASVALAERVIEAMNAPFDLGDHQVVIGTSIGIAIAPDDGSDADQLLKNADMALYRAKFGGRGAFQFFEAGMDKEAQARRILELDLRKAVTAGEFEIYYQPIVNLEQDEISGFEALLRWNHPTRGRVSPDQFIPLAEETGLIVQIGEWVVRQACAEAKTWSSDLRVAVNVSPVQFRNKNLVPAVISALAASGLPANRLELEITEAVLLQNNEATLTMLHQLRDLGVRISMDDFGTGFSSLSYLQSFPFGKIKIDQSFVRGLTDKPESIAIIRAVAGLGHSFGMTTTAEGVETQEQLDQMRAAGCTEVQGYFYGKPMPASKIVQLLSGFQKRAQAAA